MDLMLVCGQNVGYGQSVVTGLADALRNGRLDQGGFDAARNRVTNLRNSLS